MPSRRLLIASVIAGLGTLLAGGLMLHRELPSAPAAPGPMLLAPMMAVGENCILASEDAPGPWIAGCTGPQGSAAALVEETLRSLQPRAAGPYPLGYTLPVPLLTLFRRDGDGWALDTTQIDRLARTIADNPRPLVLYLFSTHFASDAAIEPELARDPANLAATRDGPLPLDQYYGAPLYNWSIARTDNALTQRREQAIAAVLDAVCRLEPAARGRIKAVTLLGEVHQLFPDFQAGMGFEAPYRVSDYSGTSQRDFRDFLRARFRNIGALNRALGSDYADWDAVVPPARDIRTEPLARYTDHIDSFAQGMLPISGWLYADTPGPQWIRIYRNGALVARTRVGLNRQDVLAARPAFGDANVGWRFDMDYQRLPIGLHRIDVMLERLDAAPALLVTRHIAIMDRRQRTPELVPQQALPAHTGTPAGVESFLDQPREHASYYYNPLVPLWHAFRQQQVVRYLQHFDRFVAQSCLADTPRVTHQILPFGNPSWDAGKFAIDASLAPQSGLALGISLYGETTYGTSFAQWYQRHGGARPYGVTEFHPLRAMQADAVREMLAAHAARGARFLSFFLEPRWQGTALPRSANLFSFDPDNTGFGSDVLYRAMQQVLAPQQAAAALQAQAGNPR